MIYKLLLALVLLATSSCRLAGVILGESGPAKPAYEGYTIGGSLRAISIPSLEEPYNASLLLWQNRTVAAVRVDKNKFNYSTDPALQQTSTFAVGFLNSKLESTGNFIFYEGSPDFPNIQLHAEDPRLFAIGEHLYAIFNSTDHGNLHGKRNLYLVRINFAGETISFGETRCINYPKARNIEKNWTPLYSGGALYLVYQYEPLTVLTTDFAAGHSIINVTAEHTDFNFPSWGFGKISGGTPFELTPDGESYISFVHSWRYEQMAGVKVKTYYMAALELEVEYPFRFRRMSQRPLVHPLFPSKPHDKRVVVFPAGLFRNGDVYSVSLGINDVASSTLSLPYAEIAKSYASQPKLPVVRYINHHSQGLQNDMAIFRMHTDRYLRAVQESEPAGKVEINLFLEGVRKPFLPLARQNWVMINQEFVQPPDYYEDIDLVLVKTRRAEQLMEAFKAHYKLPFQIVYTSFTSLLAQSAETLPPITRRQPRFWHGAAKSPYKNTRTVLETWKADPGLPPLHASCLALGVKAWSCAGFHLRPDDDWQGVANIKLYTEPLAYADVQEIQSSSRYIVAPSSIEGWGHYLLEGLGAGAIVITTDAPPMNEFISTTKRNGFLVPVSRRIPARTGGKADEVENLIDSAQLAAVVREVLALSNAELLTISQNAVDTFISIRNDYALRMRELLTTYFIHNYRT